ncbi:MAG TPA: hypothetical protein VF086_13325 [Propionibacteriaceae bacterium]
MPEGQSINDVTALLAAADEALSAGRWEEARAGFEASLEIEESGAALFGLALARWWSRDPVSSVRLQERAFGIFRREGGQRERLLRCDVSVPRLRHDLRQLQCIGGWLARASRVVEDCGLDAGGCCFARP